MRSATRTTRKCPGSDGPLPTPNANVTDLLRLPAADKEGNTNVVVEAPRGSAIKLHYDHATGVIVFQRNLPAGMVYPFDWGFIPSTHAEDDDPLDAMVLADFATWPGVVIPSRPIAIVRVVQWKGTSRRPVRNDRIIAVPAVDARYRHLRDLPPRLRRDLDEFFQTVGESAGKRVRIEGWQGEKAARAAIATAAAAYAKLAPTERSSVATREISSPAMRPRR